MGRAANDRLSLVTADLLTRLGMNLELVSTDWGTLVQRGGGAGDPPRHAAEAAGG